jgi:hypothetical protein
MANWLLIAMLLRISNAARGPAASSGGTDRAGGGSKKAPAQLHGAMTEVIKP